MKKIKKYLNDFLREIPSKRFFLFVIGEVSVAVQLIMIIYLLGFVNDWSGANQAVGVIIAGSVVLAVVCFLFILVSGQKERLNAQKEFSQSLLELQKNYYMMLLEKENQTKAFRHDIRNHLYCMRVLCEENNYSELKEYLEKLNIALDDLNGLVVQTGNVIADTIVNDIYKRFPDVKFSLQGRLSNDLKISQMDFCTIFSNLLSNAFEAANASANKQVDVQAKCVQSALMITISNSVSDKPLLTKEKFKTTKKEPGHGYGIRNAENSIKKYGGRLEMSYKDEKFITIVIIPNVVA
ncbi:MAG: GHKL domain-containing protein [Ruminococcus sp.]|nr:GHKL domain-containing protein [Ruminococcus sp.]